MGEEGSDQSVNDQRKHKVIAEHAVMDKAHS